MIPVQYVGLARIAGGAVLAAALFGAGWMTNGWRLHAELATLKQSHAEQRTKEAQAAIDMLAETAQRVRAAADAYTADITLLDGKLDTIRKEMKHAPPLPVTCRLDAVRLRGVTGAADAANAAARQRARPTVPASERAAHGQF